MWAKFQKDRAAKYTRKMKADFRKHVRAQKKKKDAGSDSSSSFSQEDKIQAITQK